MAASINYEPEHKIYALVGKPVSHSRSAEWFNRFFAERGIDAEYIAIELPEVEDAIDILYFKHDIVGLNVTSPYKRSMMKYMDWVDFDARDAGGINVVRITNDCFYGRSFCGYNTDIEGFEKAVRPLLTPAMKRALILGTGAAAGAALVACRRMGIECTQVSRTPGEGRLTYADIDARVMAEHLLVVDATPLGMGEHVGQAPPLPYELFTPGHLAFDMVYNPEVTEFMRLAAEHGARTSNGLEMLIAQARASARIWGYRD